MSETQEVQSDAIYGPDDVLVVFDGQGTQWAGMGKDVHTRYAAAREVFKNASDASGVDMARACFGDNTYKLGDTRVAQPAIATVGLAKYRAWRESNAEPAVVTGLSMGLYPAVGVSAIRDPQGERDNDSADYATVLMVSERSKIMAEVADGKNGMMVPVIGPRRSEIEAALKGTGAKVGVYLDKTVHTLTGQDHAVESAISKLADLKAKILDILPIHQAAHHELQDETIPPMEQVLGAAGIGRPWIPVVANGAFYLETQDEIINHLLSQMVESADWQVAEEMLVLSGIRNVIQFGADEKRGLARQMAKNGRDQGVRSIIFPEAA